MKLRKMSGKGDEVVAEWTETSTPEDLAKIENEFNDCMKAGYFAADISEGKNEIIQKFDPKADILLLPKMMGG